MLLVAALSAGLFPPTPAVAASPSANADAAGDTIGQRPSTAYEEAMAHADDVIAFEPGGKVETGFTPRATDRWPVDGQAPSVLPAGRATGRQMAESRQGTAWTDLGTAPIDTPTDTPIDTPAGGPAIQATGAVHVAPASASVIEPAAATGLRRQVFGFLPYWELSGASTSLNYDVLSTIAYFSIGADANGNLRKKNSDGTTTTGWGGWTSASMTSVIGAAHARGTRVVLTLSVFAWTSSQTTIQKALLGSPAARLNFAKQAAAAVRDRGADGINLDFEPLASTYSDEFVALLRTVRSELNKVRSGYQLTYDTTGYIGNYPLEDSVAAGAADAIFVMGYDYRVAGSTYAGSIDPVSGTGYDLADTVRAYVARVPASRVILGIPWYGRAWSTTSDAVRSRNQSGEEFGYSTAVNYSTVVDLVAQYGRRWDPVEQSPYLVYRRENCTATYGCVTSWRQVYYDDAASMKLRYALVNDYGLRGAGMWALGYDGGHPELYRAISESFLVDKAAPQAGITVLAAQQLDEGFMVNWSARDATGVAEYDVAVSIDGGAWVPWLTGTKATNDVWPGEDGHGYAFRVRATDTRGQVGAWNVSSVYDAAPEIAVGGFGRVVRDGLSYRTGPTTSAPSLGTLPAGTFVAFTSGPVSADGYTWYEVTQPIAEWSPVSFVERGVWVAVRSTVPLIAASPAPNTTIVNAGLRDLDFGAGGTTGAGNAALRAFSPDADGSGDTLRVRWTSTVPLDGLVLNVYRTDGSLIGQRTLTAFATGPHEWDWDGKLGGPAVADGSYLLQLVGTGAGKTYRAPSVRPATPTQVAGYAVTVDTKAPVLTGAAASATLISPNGDGVRDAVRYTLAATGATSWIVRLANAAGTVVRTTTGAGAAASFTWDGIDATGTRVPDGRYTATLLAMDNAGNSARRAFPVTVDTTGPAPTLATSPEAFSPNGDGADETAILRWTAPEPMTGTARVYRGTTLVRSWTITALAAGSATWNGRTAAGTAVPDGRYTFRVTGKDAAGNGGSASRTVTVDRTAGLLRWTRSFSPQDGDTLVPTSRISFRLARTATTTLSLYDASGTAVRTVWANRVLAAGTRAWTWNGRVADGSYAPQGRYTARLVVTSALGTQTLSRPVWAAAFAVAPSATTVKPGATLTIRFSTIETLSARPRVTWAQPGRTPTTITATRLANGTYSAAFKVAAGNNGTGTVRITARDTRGGTNSMTLSILVAA
jgi:spore germination protein YaaH/flagellar hook assembly protein FlgD